MTRKIEIVGHRGWRVRHPDNTLLGITQAAEVSDRIEVDVRRSADGKLVLAHDPEINGLVVAENSWEKLGEVVFDGGARPCLLDEALAAVPETPFLVEVKNQPGDSGFEPDHRLGLEAASRCRGGDVLISFNWMTVDMVRRHFPDVETGLNVGVWGTVDNAIKHALEMGHSHLVPDVDLLKHWDGALADRISMFVWSSRFAESFESHLAELVSIGVSGIITDDLESARRLLGNDR